MANKIVLALVFVICFVVPNFVPATPHSNNTAIDKGHQYNVYVGGSSFTVKQTADRPMDVATMLAERDLPFNGYIEFQRIR